jgi:sugar/nucleoside kinase (ribokinase family)
MPKAILLEGYVWDCPEGPALARQAVDIASERGAAVALSLSDSFCVERHRDSFAEFVGNGVDIVLANEDEINKLLQTDSMDATMAALKSYSNLFAITRSEKGSVIVHGDQHVSVDADSVAKVVDSTGAGDAYSAGFLFGWVNDYSLAECGRLGTYCATTVIQQIGARIEPGLLERYQS